MTVHLLVATKDICCGVALRMSDVEPRARWVREHIKNEVLGLRCVEVLVTRVWRVESFVLIPVLLPLGFEVGKGEWLTLVRHVKSRVVNDLLTAISLKKEQHQEGINQIKFFLGSEGMWNCSKCDAIVDDALDACHRCGAWRAKAELHPVRPRADESDAADEAAGDAEDADTDDDAPGNNGKGKGKGGNADDDAADDEDGEDS